MSEVYCTLCKCWVHVEKGQTRNGARIQHRKLCAGDPFASHPDLLELEIEMSRWYD